MSAVKLLSAPVDGPRMPSKASLTHGQAVTLDTDIRKLAAGAHVVIEALYALLNEAKASNIHETLGFPSWTAYLADALDGQWTIKRNKRAQVVKFLDENGLSQRAIARLTGLGKTTIHRELDQVVHLDHLMEQVSENDAETTTGLDGKAYPRKHRKPRDSTWQGRCNRGLERLCHVAERAVEGVRMLAPLIDLANIEDLRQARCMLENACQELDQLISTAESVEQQHK